MLARIRSSLTYANVMATAALFVALGGTSYAVATGSIDSREIKNNAVRSTDIRNNQVSASDLRNNSASGRDIRNDTLTGDDVLESALGEVPKADQADTATTATNANQLGGVASSGYLQAGPDPPPVAVSPNPASATDPCSPAGGSQTGVFCGTASGRWATGAITDQGVQFWRDRLGQVHIRGDAERLGGASLNASLTAIFVLPAGYRPAAFHVYPLSTKGTAGASASAILYIEPSGLVAVSNPADLNDTEIFIGDITFRSDA